MRFFIVRHGETQHNTDGTVTGQMDVPLNERGREQAQEVADRLGSMTFDGIYSSDLERTYETIEIVAGQRDTVHEPLEAFRERSYGVYEGEPKEQWRSAIYDHDGDTFTLRPDDGESMKEVAARYLDAMESIWRRHGRSGTFLVGGHGVAIRAVLMEVLGARTSRAYDALTIENAGITELTYRDRSWSIQRVNDTAHRGS